MKDVLTLAAATDQLIKEVGDHNSGFWNRRIAGIDIIEGEHIILATFVGEQIEGKTFSGCLFEDCTFVRIDLQKTTFIDATFDRCVLTS